MVEGFSLGNYLLLVDHSARLFRQGKATLARELAEILDRLGSTADHWHARLEKLRQGRLLGRFFATSRARLRESRGRIGPSEVTIEEGVPAPSPVSGIGPEVRRSDNCRKCNA
jgi:hypothetical protein